MGEPKNEQSTAADYVGNESAADADKADEDTTSSDGPLDKIKNALGHVIGADGPRHGARDTDPGS